MGKRNLRDDDELYRKKEISKILSEEDCSFYVERREAYLTDFPDLNSSTDMDDLHGLLMELVFQRQLCRAKKDNEGIDISDEYNDSVRRAEGFKKSLSSRRVDRTSNTKTGSKVITLIQQFANPKSEERISQRLGDKNSQLNKFLEEKVKRDNDETFPSL